MTQMEREIQRQVEREHADGTLLTTPEVLADCVSCDGYVLHAEDAPHCPTCARLLREGKPL